MKIVSYNIYRKNKNIDKVVKFILDNRFDVVSLQEVDGKHLDFLQEKLIGYNFSFAKEFFISKNDKKSIYLYNVIITKNKILNESIIKHIPQEINQLSYKLFKPYSQLIFESHYVDINHNDSEYRIFNSHLECVTTPEFRLNQFKHIVQFKSNARQNVFCGDYNIFGSYFVNFFVGIFYGYNFKDYFVNERKIFCSLFEQNDLINVFSDKITFKKLPLRTDVILIDNHISYERKRHLRFCGSDHFQLEVKL